MVQKPLKKPQIGQNHTFCLITLHPSIHPSDLYEILPNCGDTCYEHNSITVDPENSGSSPRGLLGLKIPLLGLFLMFVQNVIMYVAIVVFYSAEFKFTYAIT